MLTTNNNKTMKYATNATNKICHKYVFNDETCPNKTISLSCSTGKE